MEDLPQLEPLSLRPECEPGYEKESWKPTWSCYCCHDTGFVLDRLSSQIIPGFNSEQHKTLLSTWAKLIVYFWKAREAGEAEGAGEER